MRLVVFFLGNCISFQLIDSGLTTRDRAHGITSANTERDSTLPAASINREDLRIKRGAKSQDELTEAEIDDMLSGKYYDDYGSSDDENEDSDADPDTKDANKGTKKKKKPKQKKTAKKKSRNG